jgi:hypothetical protein
MEGNSSGSTWRWSADLRGGKIKRTKFKHRARIYVEPGRWLLLGALGASLLPSATQCHYPGDPRGLARDVPTYAQMQCHRVQIRPQRGSPVADTKFDSAVTADFVRGHRAPVTTNNRRPYRDRDPHRRCARMCNGATPQPPDVRQVQTSPSELQLRT